MTRQENGPALAFGALVVTIAALAIGGFITGWAEAETMLLLLALCIPVAVVTFSNHAAVDLRFFANLVVAGFAVKLGASAARYWALQVLYHGVGDATGYHLKGTEIADTWRALEAPVFEVGTEFVQIATGLLYVPYEPTKLGGFFIYAALAFFGQLLLYAAMRRVYPSPRLKWYGLLIFLFPNIVYWPSSIGKDSLMLLFLGIVAYGAARLFASYEVRWMVMVALGTLGCAVVRSHIALLVAVSLMTAVMVSRNPPVESVRIRRLILIGVVGILLLVAVRYAVADFGIDLSGGISNQLLEEELDPIFSNVEDQTDRGGSAVEGSAIRSPLDIPPAVIRVVFSPLPHEAHNIQALVSSILEGCLLLALFIYRAPAIFRNFRSKWRDPYILFCLVFTVGFIFGHSAILNLGIVARQRSQLIPFLLVLLVELGARPLAKKGRPAVGGFGVPAVTSPSLVAASGQADPSG